MDTRLRNAASVLGAVQPSANLNEIFLAIRTNSKEVCNLVSKTYVLRGD